MKTRRNRIKKTKRTRNRRRNKRTRRGGATKPETKPEAKPESSILGAASNTASAAYTSIGSAFGSLGSAVGFGSTPPPPPPPKGTPLDGSTGGPYGSINGPPKDTGSVNGTPEGTSTGPVNSPPEGTSSLNGPNRSSNVEFASESGVRPPSPPMNKSVKNFSQGQIISLVEGTKLQGTNADILKIALLTAKSMMQKGQLLPCEKSVANKAYLTAISKGIKKLKPTVDVSALDKFILIASDDGPTPKGDDFRVAIDYVIKDCQIKIDGIKDKSKMDECSEVINGILLLLIDIKSKLLPNKPESAPLKTPPTNKSIYDETNISKYKENYNQYQTSWTGIYGLRTSTAIRPKYPITKSEKARIKARLAELMAKPDDTTKEVGTTL